MTDEDNIEVPIIFITDGWSVDEIETEDDCDDAHAVLTGIIARIESHMDDIEMQGNGMTVEFKKARAALRWKKAALNVVNTKRGRIRRNENERQIQDFNRRIINYFKAMHPSEMAAAIRHVEAMTDTLVVETAQ